MASTHMVATHRESPLLPALPDAVVELDDAPPGDGVFEVEAPEAESEVIP